MLGLYAAVRLVVEEMEVPRYFRNPTSGVIKSPLQ